MLTILQRNLKRKIKEKTDALVDFERLFVLYSCPETRTTIIHA